jgi:hypothetical protein
MPNWKSAGASAMGFSKRGTMRSMFSSLGATPESCLRAD